MGNLIGPSACHLSPLANQIAPSTHPRPPLPHWQLWSNSLAHSPNNTTRKTACSSPRLATTRSTSAAASPAQVSHTNAASPPAPPASTPLRPHTPAPPPHTPLAVHTLGPLPHTLPQNTPVPWPHTPAPPASHPDLTASHPAPHTPSAGPPPHTLRPARPASTRRDHAGSGRPGTAINQ
ncbi:hypothetical protein FKM82_003129 [Ascaphus truei]